MNTWFTSDTHFNHTNIIKYQDRPFNNIEEMNEAFIKVWNENIKPKDEVFHLGDFVFHSREAEKIVDRLNGNITLILGNHDFSKAYDSLDIKVHHYLERKFNKQLIVMMHYPIARWRIWYHGSIHLFGHCHGGYTHELPTAMDVGVDTNKDFKPYHLDEIIDLKREAVELAKQTYKND